MSLLLADDGAAFFNVAVDVPVTVTVGIQRFIKLTIPVSVTVTVAMVKSALFKLAIAIAVSVAVGVQKLIKLSPIAVSVPISVNLQRKISKFINVNVSVVATMAEAALLHVSIAVTSSIIVGLTAIAHFFGNFPGSHRKRRKGTD